MNHVLPSLNQEPCSGMQQHSEGPGTRSFPSLERVEALVTSMASRENQPDSPVWLHHFFDCVTLSRPLNFLSEPQSPHLLNGEILVVPYRIAVSPNEPGHAMCSGQCLAQCKH